ncbi:CoA transferase [Pinirhizobacter soli]|uniref:CoA transferase n=1 Tax=Pinirhizobacter soli TaxID=2786953 RepID=UPI002029F89B|nr:CoA transferase [Pinirhizobacter soli]
MLTGTPSLQGIRVYEQSQTLAGRLAGLLLADQGAEVYALPPVNPDASIDDYLSRGKRFPRKGKLAIPKNPDIVIHDGAIAPARGPSQLTLGFTAVVPGDEDIDLPWDASDDLLNALAGFYTDLGVTSRLLGNDVTYTPLPLCSIYAAVLGVTAVCAALADRQRSAAGRAIVIPRLAAGLSAIGVLAMELQGIEPHLMPPGLLALPPELVAEVPKARTSEAHMVWLVNRLNPTAGCYRSADGQWLMPVCTVNRKLAVRLLQELGLWGRAQSLGIVDVCPYDPASTVVADRNIALPQGLRSDLNMQLAAWMEEAFATRTAVEWESLFGQAKVPCGVVQDFEAWMRCSWANEAGLVEIVDGQRQLGRAVTVHSAKPYPQLRGKPSSKSAALYSPQSNQTNRGPSSKPLSGYTVLDLANVIAGPACGRLLGELGAKVIKLDTTTPDHQPLVTVIWGAEANQGKQSLLIDLHTVEGREVLRRLIVQADILVMNATDDGIQRLGLTRQDLMEINPRAIGVQISAFKGERAGSHDDHPGYDPLLQGATGIMTRFGTPGMPLLHGIASCVDYLTGYLGAFAAVLALQARERRGDSRGDWAETSLASAATLVQLKFQRSPNPPSASGPGATGPNEGSRLYPVADGWIFAEALADISSAIADMTVVEALRLVREHGIRAVPVRSIAALRRQYLVQPSPTIRFRAVGQDGLHASVLEPTWFQIDGKPLVPPSEPPRPGGDASTVLSNLGFTEYEVARMIEQNVVGLPNWRHLYLHAEIAA